MNTECVLHTFWKIIHYRLLLYVGAQTNNACFNKWFCIFQITPKIIKLLSTKLQIYSAYHVLCDTKGLHYLLKIEQFRTGNVNVNSDTIPNLGEDS